MTNRIRPPSPAMVVASIALFAALSGGAYAVTKVGAKNLRNSAVTTKKIKNGAVTNKKLRNGAVSAGKIRSGGVGTIQIGDGAVTAARLAPGERGEGFMSSVPSGSA